MELSDSLLRLREVSLTSLHFCDARTQEIKEITNFIRDPEVFNKNYWFSEICERLLQEKKLSAIELKDLKETVQRLPEVKNRFVEALLKDISSEGDPKIIATRLEQYEKFEKLLGLEGTIKKVLNSEEGQDACRNGILKVKGAVPIVEKMNMYGLKADDIISSPEFLTACRNKILCFNNLKLVVDTMNKLGLADKAKEILGSDKFFQVLIGEMKRTELCYLGCVASEVEQVGAKDVLNRALRSEELMLRFKNFYLIGLSREAHEILSTFFDRFGLGEEISNMLHSKDFIEAMGLAVSHQPLWMIYLNERLDLLEKDGIKNDVLEAIAANEENKKEFVKNMKEKTLPSVVQYARNMNFDMEQFLRDYASKINETFPKSICDSIWEGNLNVEVENRIYYIAGRKTSDLLGTEEFKFSLDLLKP